MKLRHPGIVIYVATGTRFFSEAVESATSLRQVCPEIRIIVYTDRVKRHPVFDKQCRLSKVDHDFRDKIRGLLAFREQSGLLLDTDTIITGDVSQLFQLLTKFDMAVAHASWRYSLAIKDSRSQPPQLYAPTACPLPFCELNTGVMVFRNTKRWKMFLYNWNAEYRRQLMNPRINPANDQPAFRSALWNSDLRFYIIPPEYNYRCDFPAYAGSEVAVLHGRHLRIKEMAAKINARIGARVLIPKTLEVFHH